MADDPIPSEQADPNPIFPEDDLEDDVVSDSDSADDEENNEEDEEEIEPLNHVIPPNPDEESEPEPDDVILPHAAAATTVSAAVTPIPPPEPVSSTAVAVTVALPDPQRYVTGTGITAATPPDRRLFQRLWTDEDEIELLQGFLSYTASRGGANASGHHHDTAAFYDQIKDKLQLDFNKNQLVEKLRRLKKKYRNNLSKMSSGKDFVFKSPHDKATFEISRKIWLNLSTSYRGKSSTGGNSVNVVEFDDEEQIPNPNSNPSPNPNYNAVTVATTTPPRPINSSYVVSQINLSSASAGAGGGGGGGGGFDMNLMSSSGVNVNVNAAGLPKLLSRKRPRVSEKVVKTEGGVISNNNASINNNVMNNATNNVVPNNYVANVNVSSPLKGLVEETVRNCLAPVLKDLISTATNGVAIGNFGVGGGTGLKGVGGLALNAMPLIFSGVNVGGSNGDEKWRKQQIMELELYSKRLELVQEQVKSSLVELKSKDS